MNITRVEISPWVYSSLPPSFEVTVYDNKEQITRGSMDLEEIYAKYKTYLSLDALQLLVAHAPNCMTYVKAPTPKRDNSKKYITYDRDFGEEEQTWEYCYSILDRLVPQKIYLFAGTFDPFHTNHQLICNWALEQPTSKLVIHINHHPFSLTNKKQPATWETRHQLIQMAYQHHFLARQLEISPKGAFQDTLTHIKTNYPNAQIVQIFGSDVLQEVPNRPLVGAYAIHQRHNVPINITQLHNKPVTTIPLNLPPISSTSIRLSLMQNKTNELSNQLPASISEQLIHSSDYSPLVLSIRELRKKQHPISNDMAQKLIEQFPLTASLEDKTQAYGGKSGDTIIAVMQHDKTIAVCKLAHSGSEACEMEAQKHRLFNQFAKTPDLHFVSDNMMCMTYIAGHTPKTGNDFTRIGQAYAQVHAQSKGVDHLPSAADIQELENRINTLYSDISNPMMLKTITSIFNTLFDSYSKSTHQSSISHGDAQPGNVLLTEQGVVFIDFAKVKQTQTPARDINQMIASIYWKAFENNAVDEQSVRMLEEQIDAFLTGYSYKMNAPADKLWDFYWAVRTWILAQNKPQSALTEYINIQFNQTILNHSAHQNAHYFFNKNTAKPRHHEQNEMHAASASSTLN